jgi:AcrR family transcriptional regulator
MTKRGRRGAEREAPGTSDPVRSMELLWGVPKVATRGPRPGLTVERVVEVAIAIADGEGLDAVSMRRVAEQLGVGTMSLYTYVPGKTELLELMHDTVLGEVAWTFDESTTWRQRLESLARADWDFALRHPWMLDIPWARAPLGPNAMAGYERAASAVIGCGLTGREVTNVIGLVSMFVRSAARLAVEAAAAQRRTGQTDTEWWEARAPLLEKFFDPVRFPVLSSPEMAGGFDQARQDCDYFEAEALDSFEFGLQRILDGIEVLIAMRATERPAVSAA